MSTRIEKDFKYLTIVPNRDWKILLLFLSFVIATVIIFFSPEITTASTKSLMQGVCFTVIGIYGGIRGRGETSTGENNENNVLGWRPGSLRGITAVLFLILLTVAFVNGNHDDLPFLVTIIAESFGVAIPGVVKPEK
jgi:hypothetical protein